MCVRVSVFRPANAASTLAIMGGLERTGTRYDATRRATTASAITKHSQKKTRSHRGNRGAIEEVGIGGLMQGR